MSALEKKWWFIFPVVALTTICTRYLLESAGMSPGPVSEYGVAQWIVYLLCSCALWRGVSFIGWLVVLAVAPALADPKLRKPA